MKSTILKNPPEGFENIFAGNFTEVPNDRIFVDVFYDKNFIKPKLIDNEWVESANELEIEEILNVKVNEIKEEYSFKINLLLSEHLYNKIQNNIDIPEEISEKLLEIRNERDNLIEQLTN